MTMVSLIGYHAGLKDGKHVIAALAALVALFAFFFPPACSATL